MEIAMHAAETGHLVFATIHTNDAKQTLDRVMDSFQADRAQQIRQLFSLTLAGIIAQKLIRRKSGDGMAVAVEVLINSPHMSQLLAENKVGEITDALQKGGDYYQMQSFNQDLARLITEGTITPEEGLSNSPNPADLKLILRGVGSGSSNIRQMQKDDQEKGPRKNGAARGGNGDAASIAEDSAAGDVPAAKPRKPLANTKGFTF
jgi:twitching motility protein PilT